MDIANPYRYRYILIPNSEDLAPILYSTIPWFKFFLFSIFHPQTRLRGRGEQLLTYLLKSVTSGAALLIRPITSTTEIANFSENINFTKLYSCSLTIHNTEVSSTFHNETAFSINLQNCQSPRYHTFLHKTKFDSVEIKMLRK